MLITSYLGYLRTYIGIVARLYPLLLIYYLFYLLVIDFVYWHTSLVVPSFGSNDVLRGDDVVRTSVDYRLTQILMYFIVSANLLILSKLPTKFINSIFFTKRLASVGIDFMNVLGFYSAFYSILGFVLVMLLAFIKTSLYTHLMQPFHYLMAFLIPIYLIYKVEKS